MYENTARVQLLPYPSDSLHEYTEMYAFARLRGRKKHSKRYLCNETHLKFIPNTGGRCARVKEEKLWVAGVKTDSTHPPAGLFTQDAATIARTLASKKVSPKGPASGMRMVNYFINRAGRGLSPARQWRGKNHSSLGCKCKR
jgi:hypothetical protein